MRVADYKELRVYQLAFESAMEIFQASRHWPSEEKFSLTDQIRRSSRSVCANLAEAWRKRRYEAAFVSKLSDSDGEAAETEVHLDFALRCGYLTAEQQAKLRDHYDHICRQLTNMMNDAASWCGVGCELREVPPEYIVAALAPLEPVEPKGCDERKGPRQADIPPRRPDAPHAPRSDARHARRSPRSARS
jgi:four helix bundle protein